MQFWDIAGQEHTKVLTRNYYNAASACIIVFDITNKKSYEDVKEWKAEVDNKLGQIPTIILANKVSEQTAGEISLPYIPGRLSGHLSNIILRRSSSHSVNYISNIYI